MLRYRPQRSILNALTVDDIVKENSALKTSRCVYIIQKKISFSIRIWECQSNVMDSWSNIIFFLFVAMDNLSFIETGIILQTGLTGKGEEEQQKRIEL